jgi:hypothetical protein
MATFGPVLSLSCGVCSAGFHPAQLDPLFPELCPPCATTASQVSHKCPLCLLPRLWRIDAMLGRPCRACQRDERDVLRAVAILGTAEVRPVQARVRRLSPSAVNGILARAFTSGKLRLSRMGGDLCFEAVAA